MSSTASGASDVEQERVVLALAEADEGPITAAPWVGPIVALGGMARRYAARLNDRQLVIALSVPRRDFAAALLACGWVISAPEPQLTPPEELLRVLTPGTPARAATADFVFEDFFERLDNHAQPEARFRRWQFVASHLLAVVPLTSLDESRRDATPRLGALGGWKGLGRTWHERLVTSNADLALIGTASRLKADLEVRVTPYSAGVHGEVSVSSRDAIGNLLLPLGTNSSTHYCTIHAAARLADELPLSIETRAVVLDGYGAVKYLAEIEAPFVFCVLDRSIANETSADLLIHYRNSRGEPVSLADAIGWRPPAGVEALAFTTRL
jgi:hypothetical protein